MPTVILIVICIVVWRLWLSLGDKVRNDKLRPEIERREENKNMLITDVLTTIDRVAPKFKYITLPCRGIHTSDTLVIVDQNNKILEYNYEQHGFSPSIEAKKSLAIEIAKKYGGRWIEHKRDISDDRSSIYIIDDYKVVAHDGLREMDEERKKQESIRKC